MLRAGLIRQLAAGIYVYLPLGQRVLDKITRIIREEMNAIGGQEITMPVLHPAEIWQQSGRWEAIGGEMFRLKDRNGRDMCLGMTHEEVVAWLAAREIRSYRDLPQIWYQIQTKERDEARPRSGVLRTREFLMKDSYTLDPDTTALDRSYAAHRDAYCRIFERCGLRYHVVESDPGMMGGLGSHEFMAPSEAGEDQIAICAACGYAANVELARGVPQAPEFPAWTREEVATPGVRTIADVAAFLGIDPRLTIKSLAYVGKESGLLLALVRGDHTLNERKLARAVGEEVRPAHPEEVQERLGARPGFIGPVGVPSPVIADEALRGGAYVVGANREGYHLKGVRPGSDLGCRFVDLHTVGPGERCPTCGAPLAIERVIEVGNIFKLGTKYSVPLGAIYLDEAGKERPIVMGSYGIGPARIAAGVVEQHHDASGIVWPWAIAPLHVHLVLIGTGQPAVAMADELYRQLWAAGLETLLDDREERPGVKFNDADLLGLPARVTIGTSFTREGVIEVRSRQTREEHRVPPGDVIEAIRRVARGAALE
jgi:prolyl-tRNA synthetase